MNDKSLINQICLAYEFTQEEYADYLGVSKRTMTRYSKDNQNIPDPLRNLMREFLDCIIDIQILLPKDSRFFYHRKAAYPENVNAIKILRKRKDATQEQFGRYLGVGSTTVSRYEKGKAPTQINRVAKDIIDVQAEMDYLQLLG